MDELKLKIAGGTKLEAVQKENRHLRDQLRDAVEQLEQARSAKGLVIPERTKQSNPKIFARLIMADTHGSHADPTAISALLSDLQGVDVREIVMLGDHMECGGWMMQSHTLGYVAQMDEVCYEDDIAATNDLLDRLAKLCPRARFHYLSGNHEDRVERWIVDSAQGNKRNAEFMMRAIAPRHVLFLEKRGIPYYRSDEKYCGLEVPGTIKIGKSFFTHGITTTKHSASATVERFAGCVFFGHTHRADYSPTRLVSVGMVAAWNPGCLCVLQPRWHHNNPTTWTQGYILQIVNESDGTFHAMQVPIDNGRSYLTSLLKTVK